MKTTTRTLLPAILILCWPLAIRGQGPVPLGDDQQVNSYTTFNQDRPAVARLANGGYVVVWAGDGIDGQFYDVDGSPEGSEFQISTRVSTYFFGETDPAITPAPGGFLVVWEGRGSFGDDTSLTTIQGRRYALNGVPVGGQFQVNTYTTRRQRSASVASLADGGWVVVWRSEESGGSDTDGNSIQGRLYRIGGIPVGEDFQVNTYTTGHQLLPAVAAQGDGFVVAWHSEGSPGDDSSRYSIQARRYAAGGAPLGGQFQVNTVTGLNQTAPEVAATPDGFVVVWNSDTSAGTDTSGRSIQGQRFAADTTTLGGQFQVNTGTLNSQWFPALAAHDDGSFVVTWFGYASTGSDSSSSSIQARRYAADGSPIGEDFQVNSYTTSRQAWPAVAARVGGDFVAAWESFGSGGTDNRGASVQVRRFAAPRFLLPGLGGKCLDVEGADPTDGTPVNLYRCNGDENQRWRLDLTAVPQRVVGLGDKCLLPGPVDASGDVRVVIGECGASGDLWQLLTDGHASPSLLVHAETGLCLDVEGAVAEDGTPTILFECHGGANQVWRPAAEVCTEDAFGLCLNRERFRVDLAWRSFDGSTGSGRLVPVGSDDSGLLWFFERDNWEMLVKVLDGCERNDRFWVFAAATTTVEYTLTVTDTALGTVREYFNPLGNAAAAITDTDAFATCGAGEVAGTPVVDTASRAAPEIRSGEIRKHSTGCEASATQMCLSDGRFRVEVEWRDYENDGGSGQVVEAGLPAPGTGGDASGMFWFFERNNWEMLVKVLDACDVNGRFWLLAAATTDVEYTLRVTDVVTDETREYFNPLGTAAPALVDTFETCN